MSQTTTAMPDRQLRRRARGMPPVAQGVLATLAVLLVLLPAGWFQFQVSERALRDEIRSGLARTARMSVLSISQPVRSPACRMRRLECPPSRPSA